MGTGIWSMHYVGMVAHILPVTVVYHWPTVLASLVPAILASAVALHIASGTTMSAIRTCIGGVVMGAGIASMHYLGMDAMRLPAMCVYSPGLVTVSIVLAILISLAALRCTFHLRKETASLGWNKIGSALLMGSAIPTTHYTGMAAISFMRVDQVPDLRNSIGSSQISIVIVIAVSLIILCLAILASLMDRNFSLHIRDSEERLRLIFDVANDGIILHDGSTAAFMDANQRVCDMFGYTRQEFLNLNLGDLSTGVAPYTLTNVASMLRRITIGDLQTFEWHCKARNGRTFWAEVSVSRGTFRGKLILISMTRDITERKRTEDALRKSEAQYLNLFQSSRDAILLCDPVSAQYKAGNPSAIKLFGATDEADLISRTPWDYSPELQPDGLPSGVKAREMIDRARRDGFCAFEWTHKRVDGTEFPADVLLTRVTQGGESLLYATLRDITERVQAEAKSRLQTAALDAAANAIVVTDRRGGIQWVNPAFTRLTGYTLEEALGQNPRILKSGKQNELFYQNLWSTIISGAVWSGELTNRKKDGQFYTEEMTIAPVRSAAGAITNFVAIKQDSTERKRTADALRTSLEKYRDLFESTRDAILILEPSSGRIVAGNPSATKLFGVVDAESLIARGLSDCSPRLQPDGSISEEKARDVIATTRRLGSYFVEWVFKRSDGKEFPADLLLTSVANGEKSIIYVSVRDVADRKRTEKLITHMAQYDSLTGLANRRVFVESLEKVIAEARSRGTHFAVLYFDLDHFKDVNDTLGHPIGDLMLQEVAARLRACVRAGDTVARFGGDEFAVILVDIDDPAAVADVSERILGTVFPGKIPGEYMADTILKAMGAPFVIEGNQIRSGASIGIGVYGADAPDAETVLSQTDVALYGAKADGRGTYRFFNAAMDAQVRARVTMTAELREAIDSDQLFLVYQPQVDVFTGRIVGVEALVRWRHPARGILGPGKFIPLAERNGLILPLGAWVVRAACRQIKQWLAAGIAVPPTAVNLSGGQFKSAVQLENEIAANLAEAGLPAELLELELTESVLMAASYEHNDCLVRLRQAGHRIAIDDFGSGYSSLEYLRRYPADRIKIAQTFTADLGAATGSDAIVKAAISLSRELGMEVVVEGVETAAQLELLKAWGCRIVQGYYFAKPLPVQEITAMLRIGVISTPATAMAETELHGQDVDSTLVHQ